MGEPSSQPAVAPDVGPVTQAGRIVPLDVLRGFALLGILIMNIQLFAMIFAAYEVPTAAGDLDGAGYWVWLLGALLADLKFMAIFSMLFGAGIILQASRRQATGWSAFLLHFRRMLVLLAFGLLHAHLLWPGDILYTYALCGLVVYPLRKLSPGLLILLGLLVLAVGSGISVARYHEVSSGPPEDRQAIEQEFRPSPEKVAAETAMHLSGWVGELEARREVAWYVETEEFVKVLAWRAGGLMLLGMALFKLGVLDGSRSRRFYLALVASGLCLGVPVIAWGIAENFARDWEPVYAVLLGNQYNYWASLLVALGWVGLVMLVCRSARLRPLTRPLAAVGQMALTNYLLQTLICTTIFEGHGLGLFGQVARVGQLAIVCGVWAIQLIVSPLWLHYFRFGPAEWLWRSLTYLKVQPLLKRSEPSQSS
jgi:uncharacterized protein